MSIITCIISVTFLLIACSCTSFKQLSVPSLLPKYLTLQAVDSNADIDDIVIAPDNKRLAVTYYGSPLKLWDKYSGRNLITFSSTESGPGANPVAFLPDGDIVSTRVNNSQVTIWNSYNGDIRATLTKTGQRVTSLSVSPNRLLVAAGGSDGRLQLWNIRTGKQGRSFRMSQEITRVVFDQKGQAISGIDTSGTVQQWSIQSGKRLRIIENPRNVVSTQGIFYPVAFSRDGSLMARGDIDKKVRLWDLRTGKFIKVLSEHQNDVYAISFSPDGELFATVEKSEQQEVATGGNFHELRLWSLTTGKLLGRSSGREYIKAIIFDYSSNALMTGGSGDKLQIWSLTAVKRK